MGAEVFENVTLKMNNIVLDVKMSVRRDVTVDVKANVKTCI